MGLSVRGLNRNRTTTETMRKKTPLKYSTCSFQAIVISTGGSLLLLLPVSASSSCSILSTSLLLPAGWLSPRSPLLSSFSCSFLFGSRHHHHLPHGHEVHDPSIPYTKQRMSYPSPSLLTIYSLSKTHLQPTFSLNSAQQVSPYKSIPSLLSTPLQ